MKFSNLSLRGVALVAVILVCVALVIALVATFLRPDAKNFVQVGLDMATIAQHRTLEELTDIGTFRKAYLAKNGGVSGIEALSSILVTGTFESGGQQFPFSSVKKRTNQGITTLQMPNYKLSFLVNGTQVSQRVEKPGAEPVNTLLESSEAEALADMGYFFDPIMHVLLLESSAIKALEISEWENRPTLLMEFASSSRKINARVHFAPDTLAPLVRIETFGDGSERKVLYDDYRPIFGGIQQPYIIETYLKMELLSRVEIERILVNQGIGSFIFDFKGAPPSKGAAE